MFNFSKISAVAAVAVSLTASAASAVTMSFVGAAMTDGGSISGSFDYTGGVVSAVNVVTTPGTAVTATQAYTSGSYTVTAGVLDTIVFGGTSDGPGTPAFSIVLNFGDTFAALETGLISSAAISTSLSDETISVSGGGQFREVEGGFVVADLSPVPLPAGAPLLVAGLGGLALLRKKRKS